MELNEKIRRRRLELGMSQAALAEALGYSNRATVAKVESGVNDITQSKIEKYAEALKTTPAYLMDWTDDPYNYELDPDGRLNDIPKPLFEVLMEQHHDDPEAVWHAYEAMQEANLMEASREYKKPAGPELDELDAELLRLAAQLTPEQKQRQIEMLRDIVGRQDT